MMRNWLIICLWLVFSAAACASDPLSSSPSVSVNPNEPENPFTATSLPADIDPCNTDLGWMSLGYRDFIRSTAQSPFGITATFAHYDALKKAIYVVGNSLQSQFRVNRLNANGWWDALYQRNLSDFCQPAEEDCFLPGTEAYDVNSQLLFLSVVEDVVSIDSQAIQRAQQLPTEFLPPISIAVDPMGERLYVAHPNGIVSRPYDLNDWKIEAVTADLPLLPLKRVWAFRSLDGAFHLCGSSTNRVFCRNTAGDWLDIPILTPGLVMNVIRDIAYDSEKDRLYVLSDHRILFSEGVGGWHLWYDKGAFLIDEIELAPGEAIYARSGRQFRLIDSSGAVTDLIRLPAVPFEVNTEYAVREFLVIEGEEVGLLFEDEDGCPMADQLCLFSDIYSICLQ